MDVKILWSDTSLLQLENIFDYHKIVASHTVARKLVKSIIQKALILQKTPLIGVKEPLLSDRLFEYRFLLEKNYKIIYRFDKNLIRIITIFDCRQNPSKLEIVKD